MTATAWVAAAKALTTLMRSASGYRSPWSAAAGVPVYLGPEVGAQSEAQVAVPTLLVIADIGDPESPAEAGETNQAVATLGTTRAREERGTIRCRVIHQVGDPITDGTLIPAALDAVAAVLDDVDDVVRGNPTIGLEGSGAGQLRSMVARIEDLPSVRCYTHEAGGLVVEADFTVVFAARI